MTPETQLLREALQDIEQAHDLSLDLEHYDARQVLVGLADKIKRALSAPAQPADTAELLFAAFGDGPDDEQCKDLWFRYHSLRDWHKRTFAAQPASGEAVEAGVIEEIDTDDDGQQHAWVALANPLPLATKLYTTPPASQEQWETSPKDGEQWQTVPKASQEQAQPSGQIAGRVLGKGQAIVYDTDLPDGTELYTAPQSAQVPMTREQVIELLHRCHKEAKESAEFVLPEAFAFAVVSAIEAHHGIGGNEATDRTTP